MRFTQYWWGIMSMLLFALLLQLKIIEGGTLPGILQSSVSAKNILGTPTAPVLAGKVTSYLHPSLSVVTPQTRSNTQPQYRAHRSTQTSDASNVVASAKLTGEKEEVTKTLLQSHASQATAAVHMQEKQRASKATAKYAKAQNDIIGDSTSSKDDYYDVFISHAGEDKLTIAVPLYEELKNRGISAFIDLEELPVGEHAPSNMIKAIETALSGVFILSPEFAAKKWPMEELYRFLRRQEESQEQGDIPLNLLPVFYRLPLSACKAQCDLFERYRTVFKKHKFNERMRQGETSEKKVQDALQQLSEYTGVEVAHINRTQALIQTIADKLCDKIEALRSLHDASLRTRTSPLGQRESRHRMLPTPPSISFFVDREQTLAQLREAYHDKTKRVVKLLAGPGGIGKTQLALKFHHMVQEGYAHAFWISAESEERLTSAYLEIAKMLDIYIDEDQAAVDRIIQEVKARLATQTCLYVFDNAPSVKAIESFLPSQQGHVLITSRNVAETSWEHATERILVSPLEEKAAVIALAKQFECPIQTEDTAVLDYLLKRMSGYPLMVAQFFSFCRTQGYSPTDFVRELQKLPAPSRDEQSVLLLLEEPTDNIQYDKSISQVLRTSLQQIGREKHGENAIEILHRLAYLDPKEIPLDWLLFFFPEDTSLMKRDTRDALGLLERYSLIQWDRRNACVYIHEVTQQATRHLHFQSSLIKSLVDHLIAYVEKQNDSMYRVVSTQLLPHGRVLFDRLDKAAYPQAAHALSKYLKKACHIGCLFKESLAWSQKGRLIIEQQPQHFKEEDYVLALNDVADDLLSTGKLEQGLKAHEEALAISRRIHKGGDHPVTATSLNNVGSGLLALGKLEEAVAYKTEGLKMLQRLSENQDKPDVAHSLNSLGRILVQLGNLEEGVAYLKQGLDMYWNIYNNSNDPYNRRKLASSLNDLGYALVELGSLERGIALLQQGLAENKAIDKKQNHSISASTASSLNDLGYALVKSGKFKEGASHHRLSMEMKQQLYQGMDHPSVVYSLSDLGDTLVRLGKQEEGLAYVEKAVDMTLRLLERRHHPWFAQMLHYKGKALVMAGKHQESLTCNEEAWDILKGFLEHQGHPLLASIMHSIGKAEEGLDKLYEAIPYYRRAVKLSLPLYKTACPQVTQYFYSLMGGLSKAADKVLIQQTQEELLPLCVQWLGEDHGLTEKLRTL